jgi:hypothetical protein
LIAQTALKKAVYVEMKGLHLEGKAMKFDACEALGSN